MSATARPASRAGTASSSTTGCRIGCRLPDRKFHRGIGMYSGFHFDPNGVPLSKEEWERRKFDWLPSAGRHANISSASWRQPVYEPGKFANYIAPPRRGISQQPIDFEVRPHRSLT